MPEENMPEPRNSAGVRTVDQGSRRASSLSQGLLRTRVARRRRLAGVDEVKATARAHQVRGQEVWG